MVASHAIYRELYSHGMRRISGTKKRQLNAAFLMNRENVKRADRHAKYQWVRPKGARCWAISRSSS
ncbi:hypothetical protein BZM27_19935 [Paraburkholderia steynii]|uniref:Uncharacterized protein n=2 Tax=Paraburkholderia TaxID=1822464 RepID=A0A4R0XHH5_9BURK|nr:hypothetical protein C2L65_04395 [Paraburkholderia terrae]TCG07360.1 hypothetical protein BZM27_19935 [Paraburkholderia steynii]